MLLSSRLFAKQKVKTYTKYERKEQAPCIFSSDRQISTEVPYPDVRKFQAYEQKLQMLEIISGCSTSRQAMEHSEQPAAPIDPGVAVGSKLLSTNLQETQATNSSQQGRVMLLLLA